MKRIIWGILGLGLLFCGCQKKVEKIYIYEPADTTTTVDITPPMVAILAPSDGIIIYLHDYRTEYGSNVWHYDLTLKFLVIEHEGTIKSIITWGETTQRKYDNVGGTEFKGKEIYHIKQYNQDEDGVKRAYTVTAYDSAGNKGKDSITITTIAVR